MYPFFKLFFVLSQVLLVGGSISFETCIYPEGETSYIVSAVNSTTGEFFLFGNGPTGNRVEYGYTYDQMVNGSAFFLKYDGKN